MPSKKELEDIVWRQLQIRPSPQRTVEELQDLLFYKPLERKVSNPYNVMRRRIMKYIEEHKNQLVLPCNGNCFEHCDLIVAACYLELSEDKKENNGKA
jgi:hypothetical protein